MVAVRAREPRTLSVSVLETPFRVVFGGGVSDEDAARIADSWASCAAEPDDEARDVLAEVAATPSASLDDSPRVSSATLEQLEESLTSTLTVEAIGARRSDLLMLHACGIADDSGRVLAFVAASGTGKTTIARTLGLRFGYVTDETVAMTPDGRVLPYPKPLSVKPLTGSAPKAQLAPGSLSLRPVPEVPLRLAGVVLLERRDGVGTPFLEDVDPMEAIEDLVPQTSYLSARPRPIADLVRTLTGLGGVRRLVYSEAGSVVPLVEEAFDTLGAHAPAIWSEVLALPLEPLQEARPGSVLRAPADDVIALPDGQLLVFCEDTLVRLSGIGPIVWRHLGSGMDVDGLVAAVLDEAGPPPPGVDATAVVEAALVELEGLRVITRGAPPGPTPDGWHV
ncbi:hypothetical protein SAMN06295924_101248 [Rathayibacter rathayi NCPPB 2980 = VKM Ac-1601]|uniref:hypothetical protein n=1 Tax=Rathayibacter rathayi TaxID=33887 RepID=UPI000BD1FBB8|nr:hypothetical protein [Rathayibacter rathayi]AZZ49455.1 hypothetical protein C1O28_09820 [Rathayibacter rathayi]MWV73562.1 hypothetical protein [Rathayibacter rathayi NCPPB 2980 = VKM Ac-1601]PPF48527.1 hypothetical protein C5C08_09130 [Rathayibacter rathayi]PPG67257.1 hypothetical protein C5C16_09810 [Rathayibacter rathayi]PPG78019.1 hypothetical protein C5C15_08595 [Rathayibacter rathayi]